MSGAADDDDGPIITVDLAKHWLRQGKSWESFCAVVVFVVEPAGTNGNGGDGRGNGCILYCNGGNRSKN